MILTTIFIMLWLIAMCGWIYCQMKWSETIKKLNSANQKLAIKEQESFGYGLKDYKISCLEGDKMWLYRKIYRLEDSLSDLRKRNSELQKYKVDADTDSLIERYRQKKFYNKRDRENLEWYALLRAWFIRFMSPHDVVISIDGIGKMSLDEPVRQFVIAGINNELMSIESKLKSDE